MPTAAISVAAMGCATNGLVVAPLDGPLDANLGEVRDTFDKLVDAANRRDAEAYGALLCLQVRELYRRYSSPPISGFPPTEVIRAERPTIDGAGNATVFATVRLNGVPGQPPTSTNFTFVHEGGRWKYCPDNILIREGAS